MACALSWEGQYQQVHSGERAASFVPRGSMHAPPLFAEDSQRRVAANTLPSEMRPMQHVQQGAANTLPSEVRPVQHVQQGVEEQHDTPLCELQVKGVGRNSNQALSHIACENAPRVVSTLNRLSCLVPDAHRCDGCGGTRECKPTMQLLR